MTQQAPPQPTNEQMFGHLAVSEQAAKEAQSGFDNKFNNFFSEVQKPIGELKKFASEEEELAYWSSIGTTETAE
jgi:fructose-1,6-bisphosphatase